MGIPKIKMKKILTSFKDFWDNQDVVNRILVFIIPMLLLSYVLVLRLIK